MPHKFQIIKNSLIIIDTDSNVEILDTPKKDVYYRLEYLNNIVPYVFLHTAKDPDLYKTELSNCVNDSDDIFTKETFKTFAHDHLGYQTAEAQEVTISGTLPVSIADPITTTSDNTPYDNQVANGDIAGSEMIFIEAYNIDVDLAAAEILAAQGGTFNIMTTATTLNIFSSSANDASAGTGARTVKIKGINASFEAIEETVTLNGTTHVTTTNTFLGVNDLIVLTAGTNKTNAGDITIRDTANAIGTQGFIPTGTSISKQAIYHVPLNKSLIVDFLEITSPKSAGGYPATVTIKGFVFSRDTGVVREFRKIEIENSVENFISSINHLVVRVQQKEVLYFTVSTTLNDTKINLSLNGIVK